MDIGKYVAFLILALVTVLPVGTAIATSASAKSTKWQIGGNNAYVRNVVMMTNEKTYDSLEEALVAIHANGKLKGIQIFFREAGEGKELEKEVQEWLLTNRPKEWRAATASAGNMHNPKIYALHKHVNEALAASPTAKRLAAVLAEHGRGEIEKVRLGEKFSLIKNPDGAVSFYGSADFTIKATEKSDISE